MNESKGNETPDVPGLFSEDDGESKTAEAKYQLESENQRLGVEVQKLRHAPGLLGRLFGGQANATTNIIGIVATLAMVTIVMSLFFTIEPSVLEVSKAIVFLAIGAFGSKKLGLSE